MESKKSMGVREDCDLPKSLHCGNRLSVLCCFVGIEAICQTRELQHRCLVSACKAVAIQGFS
jgi:hypothetical protein